MNDPTAKSRISIARGNIYLPLETYEKYLRKIEVIALLPHENGILIIPLIQDSAGGLLLKIRNLSGDRVIHAQEFFRQNNYLEEFEEKFYEVEWQSERAALLIVGVFKTI